MKYFEHSRVDSFAEASELLLADPAAEVIAGGSDLLSSIKNEIFDEPPSQLIDLKRIPDTDTITVTDDTLIIGANTRLSAIAQSPEIRELIPALAQAAHSVATPLIRNLGTIAGNICQDVRCWFYRYPHEAGGRLNCRRKGGDSCYAIGGDNRYHSVFGGMRCGATPCTVDCPAATNIPEYMEQLRLGNPKGAAQILFAVNPIPAVTSRVCAHRCQSACNKSDSGEPVAIRNVERYVGDFALFNRELFYAAPTHESGKSVAVVGSGPAGLSAAYYLRQSGHAVTVYDSKDEPGGMLMYAIPDYRMPKPIVRDIVAAYKEMGITFVTATTIGTHLTASDLEDSYDALYYATGTWKRPVLGLSGEELTVFGLDFLVQVHDWMDGKVGSEVFVAGGGNVAMDVAITAKRLGAKRVVLAALETEDIMPAGSEEIARAKEEGVEINGGWGLSQVISDGGTVCGMELKRCVSVYNDKGRFQPIYDENDRRVIKAENILMAVGQQVDLNFLDEKYQMQLTARGLIDIASLDSQTSRPGVFAGGDATTGPSTVVECIASGHAAARGINRYLGTGPEHLCTGLQIPHPFLSFDVCGITQPESLKLAELPMAERSIDREDETAPDEDAATNEATRCMNCGCYAVQPSDITPVLVALDATIVTTSRTLSATQFATSALKVDEVLEPGELVREVRIPIPRGATTAYDKFRLRDAIDFAMYSLASSITVEGGCYTTVHLVLGGSASVPLACTAAEEYCVGKPVNLETAAQAAELALADSWSLGHNEYKIEGLKALIADALLRAEP
jgi:NADPH-dependent glutamate synthase beta subunit-like oxidoreductase